MAASLTKEKRERLRCWATDTWDNENGSPTAVCCHALDLLRYEATVCDLESERDGLKDEVREWQEKSRSMEA